MTKKAGWIECFAGVSGDMLLGALVDAGVSVDLLRKTLAALNIGAELHVHSVDRSGIRAAKVDVLVGGKPAESACNHHDAGHAHAHDGEQHHHEHEHHHAQDHSHEHEHDRTHKHDHAHVHGRNWPQIRALIEGAAIADEAKRLALQAFELLAHAEAKIHGIPVEKIHFHEVGAVDAIADIVCASAGFASLGASQWHCSAVNVGSGFVQCAHGRFPVPAPATAELLKGVPTYAAGPQVEMTTPTGAALLRALECRFAETHTFIADRIGYGAGTRNPERFPNVVRLSIGVAAESNDAARFPTDKVTVLECAIDDASPQVLAHALDLALENGALDVMALPATMKKGRMGTLLTVLCKPEHAAALEVLIFRETTTLGIRKREEKRLILDRVFAQVDTAYGKIRVKVASAFGERLNAMPEYEDCRRAAREFGIPLRQVMEATLAAYAVQRSEVEA